jgi:hypothetical protein
MASRPENTVASRVPARLRALQRCLTAVELDLAAHPARAMTPATLLGLALARLEGPAGGCFSL